MHAVVPGKAQSGASPGAVEQQKLVNVALVVSENGLQRTRSAGPHAWATLRDWMGRWPWSKLGMSVSVEGDRNGRASSLILFNLTGRI